MKYLVLYLSILFSIELLHAQTPNTHLDIESTEKGILIPRMDSSVRNGIIPNLNEESLLVYDNDLKQFMFWDGSEWSQIGNKEQYVDFVGQNILMGQGAGNSLEPDYNTQQGRFNTIIGNQSGTKLVDGIANTFLGTNASSNMITGDYNTIIGNQAGGQIDSSRFLTSIGYYSGHENQGNSNSFFGSFSGRNNTTGRSNTFLGHSSGSNNETGSSSVMIGENAGQFSKSGFRNTFLGNAAGYKTESGHRNTFLGNSAGSDNVTGARNTYIGLDAGRTHTGSYNIMIGYGAGFNYDSLFTISNSIFIGNAVGNESPSSHQLIIETNDNSNPLIHGDFLTDSLTIGGALSSTSFSTQLLSTDLTLKVKPSSIPLTCTSSDSEGVIYYRNHKLQICTVTDDTNPMSLVYGWVELH